MFLSSFSCRKYTPLHLMQFTESALFAHKNLVLWSLKWIVAYLIFKSTGEANRFLYSPVWRRIQQYELWTLGIWDEHPNHLHSLSNMKYHFLLFQSLIFFCKKNSGWSSFFMLGPMSLDNLENIKFDLTLNFYIFSNHLIYFLYWRHHW